MTQPSTTPAAKRVPRPRAVPRPSPGAQVSYEGLDGTVTGKVVESDEYLDTLQRRGVPISAQVLVEWPREGGPVRVWELISTLTLQP
jgi:hypothetical protein